MPIFQDPPDSPSTVLAALLVQTGAGSEQAFARVYDLVAPRAYGVVVRMLPQRDSADSALNAVFLDVWRSAAHFDPAVDDAVTWVLRIAHRRAAAHTGASPRVASPLVQDDDPRCPEGDDLLHRIYFDGWSYDELATRHDLPAREVAAAVGRAMSKRRASTERRTPSRAAR